MTKINLTIPHGLTEDEAVRKIKGLLNEIKNQFADKISDLKENWNGNTGNFSISVMGFSASGTLNVGPSEVRLCLDLPLAAIGFKRKIETVIRERAVILLTPSVATPVVVVVPAVAPVAVAPTGATVPLVQPTGAGTTRHPTVRIPNPTLSPPPAPVVSVTARRRMGPSARTVPAVIPAATAPVPAGATAPVLATPTVPPVMTPGPVWKNPAVLFFGGVILLALTVVVVVCIVLLKPKSAEADTRKESLVLGAGDSFEIVVPEKGESELVVVNYRLASVWVNGPVKIWKVHSNGTKSLTKDREGNPLIIRPTDDRVDHGYAPYGYRFESADEKPLVATVSFRRY